MRAGSAYAADSISLLGNALSAKEGEEFAKRMPATDVAAQFLGDHATLVAAWKGLEDNTLEGREVRDAGHVLGVAWRSMADGHVLQVLEGFAGSMPVAALAELLTLSSFAKARGWAERKAAEGDTATLDSFISCQQFFKQELEPRVANAMQYLAEAPVQNLQRHWAAATLCFKQVKRAIAGVDVPQEEELSAVLHEAMSIDAAEDLASLQKVACTPLQTQRFQVLSRCLSAASLVAKVWLRFEQEFEIATLAETLDSVLKVKHENAALAAWVEGNHGAFPEIDRGWFATADELDVAGTLLHELLQRGKDSVGSRSSASVAWISRQAILARSH